MKVAALCLGGNTFGWTTDQKASEAVLDADMEAGGNFIDTADIYSRWAPGNPGGVAETIVGRWLAANPSRRGQVALATKVRGPMGDGPNDAGLSRRHILSSVEASLRRLGTETIDLYQTHWPDADTPIEETLQALDSLVRRGMVRYVGCSNYTASKLVQALWASDRLGLARFDSLQPHYNLMRRSEFERELEAVAREYGLGVIPYSPLAGGFLTSKYSAQEPIPAGSRGASSRRIQGYVRSTSGVGVLNALSQVASERGKSVSQVALGWLLTRPSVTSPIIGPRSVGQLADNLGAVGLRLDEDACRVLDDASAWEPASD
jgi:aryl-alcohol dehydrogenase-like predicted oxidoreductase